MEYAVALNYRDDNPCSRIGPVLGTPQDLVQHMRALPHRDAAAAVAKVPASKVIPAVKLAFEFFSCSLPPVGRGAWRTMGRDGHGGPSVDRTAHADQGEARAPRAADAPRRAEQIFDAARAAGNGGPLVPSARGKRMNDMAAVERIVIRPGALVTPDTVIVELSNPRVGKRTTLEASLNLDAAEARYSNRQVKSRSERELLNRRAVLAMHRGAVEDRGPASGRRRAVLRARLVPSLELQKVAGGCAGVRHPVP